MNAGGRQVSQYTLLDDFACHCIGSMSFLAAQRIDQLELPTFRPPKRCVFVEI